MSQTSGTFQVPFGTGSISFSLPDGLTGSVAQSQCVPAIADSTAECFRAVERPIGTARLRDMAKGKRTACIAVTDATRNCPDHLLVPPLLSELGAAGVPDVGITILVAVGAHRASTAAEKRAKLGGEIVDRYRVIDHDAADPSGLVNVLDGPGGVPFLLSRTAVEADILLATGRVEPHQYAGFSGGGKTVAIGCASDAIIAYTHGPAMLDLPGTRLARLDGNPFQEAVREVARAAGLAFVANVVLDDEDGLVSVAYGAPEAVQDQLAEIAREIYVASIPAQVDIAVAGVGFPKDVNLYQASRAASYLQYGPTPVVRSGGVIIIPAACPEGAGEGVGEQRFLKAMQHPGGMAGIIADARAEGIRPGEQRAYIMASVLSDVLVIVAGTECREETLAIGCLPARDIDEALAMAVARVGTPATALVVPHALLTLPVVMEPVRAA
jgi:lactate racemase